LKAIILAAGKGERIKKISQSLPKPMLNVNGKPILQHNIELCKRYGIKDIYINLKHLPEKITEYFNDGKDFGVNITYSYEKELLGTAGAVKKIANEYWSVQRLQYSNNPLLQYLDSFFVIYGDNISNFNLKSLIKKNEEVNSIGVIGFHYREDISNSGVAEFDKNGKINLFIEKPRTDQTESHWVNAGVYYLSAKIFSYIPKGFSDFATDVFPLLLEKNKSLYGVCCDSDVFAFDTPAMYLNSLNKIKNVRK